jgi:hypothetical protein
VLIMALSPAASAVTPNPAFKNASPQIYDSLGIQGCSTGKLARPGISMKTGGGHLSMSGTSKTCFPVKGGSSVISQMYGDVELGATETMKLTKPATQVNISWNISALATTAAVGKLTHCPWQNYSFYGISINASGGTSGVFINESDQYCAATSEWEIYSEPEVYDMTTGTYTTGFAYMQNESGNYYDNYTETLNYTAPGWVNQTYSGSYSQVYGASSSTRINWAPSTVLSGSWAKGDRLVIYAQIYVYASTAIEYAKGGNAKVSFLAATGLYHADLTSLTLT